MILLNQSSPKQVTVANKVSMIHVSQATTPDLMQKEKVFDEQRQSVKRSSITQEISSMIDFK